MVERSSLFKYSDGAHLFHIPGFPTFSFTSVDRQKHMFPFLRRARASTGGGSAIEVDTVRCHKKVGGMEVRKPRRNILPRTNLGLAWSEGLHV
jgi:hypothetical protein